MSRFKEYLSTIYNYKNWIFPDKKTIEMDWSEFKKKENTKWKSRANTVGFRWPMFEDLNDFIYSLKQAKVIELTDSFHSNIQHATDINDMDDLQDMVNSYRRPRDLKRILSGFKNNSKIPYPIILKGRNGYFIMAGNTRTNSARILGIKVKVLLIDLSN